MSNGLRSMPPQISVDRFIRTTITAVQINQIYCRQTEKACRTCMKAAQDGLMLDGREAAPVTAVRTVRLFSMANGWRHSKDP